MTNAYQATVGDAGQLILSDPEILTKLGLKPRMQVFLVLASPQQAEPFGTGSVVFQVQPSKPERIGSDAFKNL